MPREPFAGADVGRYVVAWTSLHLEVSTMTFKEFAFRLVEGKDRDLMDTVELELAMELVDRGYATWVGLKLHRK